MITVIMSTDHAVNLLHKLQKQNSQLILKSLTETSNQMSYHSEAASPFFFFYQLASYANGMLCPQKHIKFRSLCFIIHAKDLADIKIDINTC
jgi:hypothetical protein